MSSTTGAKDKEEEKGLRDPSRLLTLVEAARTAGVSTAALKRDIEAGTILAESDRRNGRQVQVVRLGELARVHPRVLGAAGSQFVPSPSVPPPRTVIPHDLRETLTREYEREQEAREAAQVERDDYRKRLLEARQDARRSNQRADVAEVKVATLEKDVERAIKEAETSSQKVIDLARLIGIEQGRSQAFQLQLEAAQHDRVPSTPIRPLVKWGGAPGLDDGGSGSGRFRRALPAQ